MKKTLIMGFLGVLLLAAAGCIIYVPVPYEEPYPRDRGPVGEEDDWEYDRLDTSYFYDYLSPYGVWVYDSSFGYVWVPRVDRYGWHPYTYGRWVWTDYGWTWISSFNWGWAPFHYGRWGWDNDLGWFWVPGSVWAPAWVTWRTGSLYIGWAPLPPDVRFVWGRDITYIPYDLGGHYWAFVEGRHFYDTDIYRYVIPRERNRTIIRDTVSKTSLVQRGDRIINEGADLEQIRRYSRETISRRELEPMEHPGSSRVRQDSVRIFKPSVAENERSEPKEVIRKEDVSRELSKVRTRRPDDRSDAGEERRLEEAHRREIEIMEETQEQEEREIARRSEIEKQKVENPEQKEKIEKEYRQKSDELKESHSREKEKIKERHKKEEKKVEKKKIKKN